MLLTSTVVFPLNEGATVKTDEMDGIERREVISIVVLGKGGLELWTIGAPQDGDGFDVTVPRWTVLVTVLVRVVVKALMGTGAVVLVLQAWPGAQEVPAVTIGNVRVRVPGTETVLTRQCESDKILRKRSCATEEAYHEYHRRELSERQWRVSEY